MLRDGTVEVLEIGNTFLSDVIVATRYGIALCCQNFCDTAHADATNAHKMNMCVFFIHVKLPVGLIIIDDDSTKKRLECKKDLPIKVDLLFYRDSDVIQKALHVFAGAYLCRRAIFQKN